MFRQMTESRMNDIHFKYDEESGLKSIIAIHNTLRGPALGGCRAILYSSAEAALTDAIRLARGMSYKAALAGLRLGGGKAVIMQPAHDYSKEKIFKAFGRFVEELNGRYITAMDSGVTVNDMDWVATQTNHVTCTSTSHGNPAFYTAKGVFLGINASLNAYSDLDNNLSGMRIAIQGLGNVGYALCKLLHAEGARLFVSDIDKSKVTQCINDFDATGVAIEDIHKISCDIFSPCGLGGVLNADTIPELQCCIVAGSANNQLLTPECGQLLLDRGILYAPDYLINSGGLMVVSREYNGWSEKDLNDHINHIYHTTQKIFKKSKETGQSSHIVADHMAEAILSDSTKQAI